MNEEQAARFARDFEVLREKYDLDDFMLIYFVTGDRSMLSCFRSVVENDNPRKNRQLIEQLLDQILGTLVTRNGLDLFPAAGALKGMIDELTNAGLKASVLSHKEDESISPGGCWPLS